MLKRTSPLAAYIGSYDDEKSHCTISIESEKESTPVVDIDLADVAVLSPPISTTTTESKVDQNSTTVRQDGSESTHPFTFQCRPRSFPATLISPPTPANPLLSCATSKSTTSPSTTTSAVPVPSTCNINGAGLSINEIQDSFVACTIEPPMRESYSSLSNRRYGFETCYSNVRYSYASSKPYRFTSPLSPDPKIRKRSKHRRHKPKSAPASLLQKTLRRNHADALRKRYPPPPRSTYPSPPNYDFLPSLDEDDDDEFDDDEDDEIIDDFDYDGDAQVDDIVDMYNQPSYEQDNVVDVCSNGKSSSIKQTGPESVAVVANAKARAVVAEGLIHISTSEIMTDPISPRLEPVSLKPVLEEAGAFVYVALDSEF